jgi:hypothetical protein
MKYLLMLLVVSFSMFCENGISLETLLGSLPELKPPQTETFQHYPDTSLVYKRFDSFDTISKITTEPLWWNYNKFIAKCEIVVIQTRVGTYRVAIMFIIKDDDDNFIGTVSSSFTDLFRKVGHIGMFAQTSSFEVPISGKWTMNLQQVQN